MDYRVRDSVSGRPRPILEKNYIFFKIHEEIISESSTVINHNIWLNKSFKQFILHYEYIRTCDA